MFISLQFSYVYFLLIEVLCNVLHTLVQPNNSRQCSVTLQTNIRYTAKKYLHMYIVIFAMSTQIVCAILLSVFSNNNDSLEGIVRWTLVKMYTIIMLKYKININKKSPFSKYTLPGRLRYLDLYFKQKLYRKYCFCINFDN